MNLYIQKRFNLGQHTGRFEDSMTKTKQKNDLQQMEKKLYNLC